MNGNSEIDGQLKCPFRATLITRSFSCPHASEITRRDGPDIGCNSATTNKICSECLSSLKKSALPELGFIDDLTVMPASAMQKIQYGGLLALQAIVLQKESGDTVDNIASLMEAALEKYHSIENLPVNECLDTIVNYKLKRRGGR